jgi:hypothetical protein
MGKCERKQPGRRLASSPSKDLVPMPEHDLEGVLGQIFDAETNIQDLFFVLLTMLLSLVVGAQHFDSHYSSGDPGHHKICWRRTSNFA